MLEADINSLIAAGDSVDGEAARAAFAALRDALRGHGPRGGTRSGAMVVPGARTVSIGKGPEWGLSLSTAVIVKYRDSRTDTRTELEAWIR